LSALCLGGQLLDLGADIGGRARKGRRQLADRPVLAPGVAQGPPPAEELEAEVAADLFDRPEADGPDLARAPAMGPAAGRPVEAVDLDDPQKPVLLGRPAQGDLADPLLGHEIGFDLAVLPDDGVGPVLDPVGVGVGDGPQADLQSRNVRAQVERKRFPFEDLPECLRQDVLPRVLLHVIEARRPVDQAADPGPGDLLG
jgi:hypothetical protein